MVAPSSYKLDQDLSKMPFIIIKKRHQNCHIDKLADVLITVIATVGLYVSFTFTRQVCKRPTYGLNTISVD